jgi:hypothetical protein
MRAGVGAICGLGRALRFLAEADVLMRLDGALLVVDLGAVFAGELDVPVCAVASAGASKSNVPQENSAAEM